MARHHLKVVQEAAEAADRVNPHEPIKDTGLRRTWPNWVAREGARGMEFNAWGQPPNPPEHEANLVFTRMLAGPMDFTPGILSLEGRGQPILSTQAKQLALYVVIYSPIADGRGPDRELREGDAALPVHQGRADRLGRDEGAERRDRRFRHHRPQGPEQRELVSGVGDRRERAGARGAFVLPEPRPANTAPQIYRDGPNADYRGRGKEIVIEERNVTSADVLTLRLAPGGGQAIRFVAGGK